MSSSSSSPSSPSFPIQKSIEEKISACFSPIFLQVENESYKHNVPKGSETHFKLVVVSERFEGKPLIEQHRMVNEVLKEELQSGVHALSISTKTPKKWEESEQKIHETPSCIRPPSVPMK